MADRVHFILGVHNHQPIGNFDFVFEKAYQQAYLPFLEVMERHPRIHWNLHATGILWEWLERHHSDYLDRINQQVSAGRLEILTGGYYEPILSILPERDQSGQIQKLSRFIRQRFKSKPKGMWLAERVWEPHLAKVLHDNDVQYTLVDDTHFLSTGMPLQELCGSYVSEEQGATVQLLPIRHDLRYAIPFKDPEETLKILRSYANPSGQKALLMFDDGEKFGLWPDTFKHVYEGQWLERFLTALENNSEWVVTSRLSDYLSAQRPMGRVYLPTASYEEMGEWALPEKSQTALSEFTARIPSQDPGKAQFVRGGFWRNFLTKYEESNNLHKKMLRVSEKVKQAAEVLGASATRVVGRAGRMFDALWAGQCNCPYWHGVFGGLYLPHLRQAVYKELLSAEQMADRILTPGQTHAEFTDFDKDGYDEVLLESPEQNLYFAPQLGGSLFEWDIRGSGINLGNVLTRRAESYHRKLKDVPATAPGSGVQTIHDIVRVKEPGLEKKLFQDWYRRTSLLDHFLHPNTSLEGFYECRYGEQGDFVKGAYEASLAEDQLSHVRFYRRGTVWTGEQRIDIAVEKTVSSLGAMGWQVVYRIQNVGGAACDVWFGSEMNLAFSSQDLVGPQDHGETDRWVRRDHGYGLTLKVQLDQPMGLWEFPLETVSLSEEGFERTYQGTVILVHSRLSLNPGDSWVRSWKVGVSGS